MNLEEITERIAAFERDHAVQKYQCHGWHVWPHIRQRLLFGVLGEPIRSRLPSRRARVIRRAQGLMQHAFESLGTRAIQTPGATSSAAVILTYAGREIPRGRRGGYHTVIDPLVEVLRAHRISTAVWEVGEIPQPRWEAVVPITPPLRHACRQHQLRGLAPRAATEPDWFQDFFRWTQSDLGIATDWSDWEAGFRHITIRAAVIEEWLGRSGCRAVFVDCWYNFESQAAVLAAHRLGIPSIDVQHGLHGHLYHHWGSLPEGGYENMPWGYWVWGRSAAEALLESSPNLIPQDRIFVAGNLWLDKWRVQTDEDLRNEIEAARILCSGREKSILITLQHGVDLDDLYLRLIAESPDDWLWLIRPHRRRGESLERVEQRYRETGHSHINIIDAAERPLYALLSAVDAHVTGYSTCAMEALAFGKPSALVHPDGPTLYPDPVARGAMVHTPTPEATLKFLHDCSGVADAALRESADALFASHDQSVSEFMRLLRRIDLCDETEAPAP